MLQFLFDTDHLTLLERGHPTILQHLAAHPPGSVGLSAVSIEEALRGRLGFLSRPLTGAARVRAYALLLGTVNLVNQLPVVPFDDPCETQFQHLRAQTPRIGTQDLKIAAVALANRLTLLTRNQRDFGRIPGITLADWSL